MYRNISIGFLLGIILIFLAGCDEAKNGSNSTDEGDSTTSDKDSEIDTETDSEIDSDWGCSSGKVKDDSGECVDNPCKEDSCTDLTKNRCLVDFSVASKFTCACSSGYEEDEGDSCIPIIGDKCVRPETLESPFEDSILKKSFTDLTAQFTASCVSSAKKDAVYTFSLDTKTRVRFLAQSGGDSCGSPSLFLRTECDDSQSEIACAQGKPFISSPGEAEAEVDTDSCEPYATELVEILNPGTYSLFISDVSNNHDYVLDVTFRTDPCTDMVCTNDMVCVPDETWDSGQCKCPEGQVDNNGECVDDPCDPNPCGDPDKEQCTVELPDKFSCSCRAGYVEENNVCVPGDGDGCDDLKLGVQGTYDLVWEPTGFSDSAQGSCGGDGADMVLLVEVTQYVTSNFYALIQGVGGVVYLRSVCDDPSTEIKCAKVGPEMDDMGEFSAGFNATLQPGKYYLFIDSSPNTDKIDINF